MLKYLDSWRPVSSNVRTIAIAIITVMTNFILIEIQ